MRFLVDECLPYAVTVRLRHSGHDVFDPRDQGLRGAVDDVLLNVAIRDSRTLLTRDVALGGQATRALAAGADFSAVLIRFPSEIRAQALTGVVLEILTSTPAGSGVLVVASPSKIRVRRWR